jgi:hypothetical protein
MGYFLVGSPLSLNRLGLRIFRFVETQNFASLPRIFGLTQAYCLISALANLQLRLVIQLVAQVWQCVSGNQMLKLDRDRFLQHKP